MIDDHLTIKTFLAKGGAAGWDYVKGIEHKVR